MLPEPTFCYLTCGEYGRSNDKFGSTGVKEGQGSILELIKPFIGVLSFRINGHILHAFLRS